MQDQDLTETTFSECYWKFIRENVGITRINTSSRLSARQKKNKKVFSFEER